MGILDSSGALVVEYKYDAWGKPLSITRTLKTTLGELNPFRYRGYVYDAETELYYLRSRYYNAELKRFINSDNLISKAEFFINGYGYCSNNPIAYLDPIGKSMISIIDSDWVNTQLVNTIGTNINSASTLIKIEQLLSSGDHLFTAYVDYRKASSNTKRLWLPSFALDNKSPNEIRVISYDTSEKTCGLGKKILKNACDIIGMPGGNAGSIIDSVCMFVGLPTIGDHITSVATVLTDKTNMLDGIHSYTRHTLTVDYVYPKGEKIHAIYSFNSSDYSECNHFNGIQAHIQVYHGFMPGDYRNLTF